MNWSDLKFRWFGKCMSDMTDAELEIEIKEYRFNSLLYLGFGLFFLVLAVFWQDALALLFGGFILMWLMSISSVVFRYFDKLELRLRKAGI